MKKIIVILTFILTDIFGIDISVETSYLQSASHEFVYIDTYKVSELIWSTNSQILVGVEASQKIGKDSKLVMNYKSLASRFKGVMDDYDWQFTDISEYSDWSHHENTVVDNYSKFNIYFDNELYKTPDFSLNIQFGYKYDYKAFSVYDGTAIYSNNQDVAINAFNESNGDTFQNIDYTFSGYVGGYKEYFEAAYIGAKLSSTMDGVTGSFGGNIPIVGRAYSQDRHELRSFTNYNIYDYYTYIHLDLSIDYRVINRFNIGLKYEFENNLETRGITYRQYDDKTYYYDGSSAISNVNYLITLYLNYTFISD